MTLTLTGDKYEAAMKHSYFVFGLAVALFAACSTQEKDFQEPLIDDIVFYASFEQPTENETRVYANEDLHLRWNADDRVSIFNKLTYNQEYKFTGQTGADSGGFKKVDGDEFITGNDISHVVSVYPYQESTSITEDEVLTVTLPSEQIYVENTFGLGANTMVSVSESNVLHYKNVGGYLMLKLYGKGVAVSSITLKGNSGERIAGNASVIMSLEGVPIAVMASEATDEIILTCKPPVALGATEKESTPFWFVIPPVTFDKGFTISILEASGGYFDTETSKSITIERSHLTKMSAKEVDFVSPSIPIPEAVDLGLSVKWASFNLGASTPEGYGDYYAWGETEPYYRSLDPLIWKEGYEDGYTWLNYKWSIDSQFTLTKYCDNPFFGYDGITDGHTILTLEDDAANVALAGNWRMPTLNEWTELLDNCSSTWTKENGVNGRRFTSKKNGYSIFLPAAGSFGDTNLRYPGTYGVYWSSSMAKDVPCNGRPLIFDSSEAAIYGKFSSRYGGFSIRPVYGDIIPVVSVSLDKKELEISVGETTVLEATVLPTNAAEKGISWSSNNTSVATVSSTGVVTGVAVGSAIITVTTTDGGKTATCNVTVTEASSSVPEAVDLGLSVKWASFNLGASKPEEYGDYYAWGELAGKDIDSYTKSNYKYYENGVYTKYTLGGKMVLDPEDDAATVSLGDHWRTPSLEEYLELFNTTKNSVTWTTMNGVVGWTLTSRTNGNSIFIPAGGQRRAENPYDAQGQFAFSWTRDLYPYNDTYAYALCLYDITGGTYLAPKSYINETGNLWREIGLPIRPVYAE